MAKGDKKLKNSKSGEKDSPKNKINNKRKNGRGDEAGPSSKKNKSYQVVNDERFQSVHYDPIFQNIPKKESKVEVDSRFDRMFTDESFGNRSRAKIDKRGRVKEKKESHLTRYYVEEKEKKKKEKGAIEEEEKIDDDERESEEEEERVSKEVEETENEEEEEEESTELKESSSSDDDDDYEEYEDEDTMKNDISQYLLANQGNVTTTNEETHRLAIVNLDWDNIKAADLYVVLSSCLPSGGQILSVSIYPTDFGLKCMEIEAAKGPSILLNDNEDNSYESDSEDNSENNEKLRSYELNKLSYYHGVAVFDSSTTANHVYEFLDGTEFLSTANVFDLRFIPDSTEFRHPPRDAATEAPASYSAPDFQTRALQHSDVKLTWEEDDPKRTKTLRRRFNPDELDELNEYLASSEDDSEADESEHENDASEDEYENGKSSKKHKDGEKYRELLLSGNKSNSDEDEAGDMEVTFKPELEEINKRILEKKNKKPETVWEQLCQKNREKKKARRNRSKNASSDEDSTDDDADTRGGNLEEHDDFFMEDEPVNSVKSSEKARGESSDEKEREATREELELLVADDNNDNVKGYKVKRNSKKVKGKKGKMDEGGSKLPDVDPSKDPRFAALLTSHLYALDPTDPQYKRTAAYARQQLDKKNKSKNPKVSSAYEKEPSTVETEMNDDTKPHDTEKYELSSAIKSIKKNLKNIKKSTKSK